MSYLITTDGSYANEYYPDPPVVLECRTLDEVKEAVIFFIDTAPWKRPMHGPAEAWLQALSDVNLLPEGEIELPRGVKVKVLRK